VPFKSNAQARFAFGKKMPWAEEWAKQTDFQNLPERVSLKPKGYKDAFDRHMKKEGKK
jgi:hypothetical protein